MSQTLLIDVRTREEFNDGCKAGAINIPIQDIMSGDLGIINEVPKDTSIECYCASGARSEAAKNILNQKGYTHVSNLGRL